MMEMFDLKSIEANKQGKKSEKQVKEIKEAVNPGIWLWGGLFILAIGGCFYLVLSTLAGSGGGISGAFGILLALVGLVAALRGFTTWNLRRKLLSEPIQAAEGTVKYITPGALAQITEPGHYSAETSEGKKLHPQGLAGFNPKLPPGNYRFYFLKTRSWLLESEPLFSEAEMRSVLNEHLATVLGYDQAYLENCRREASLGQMKIVEGLPKLETSGGGGDDEGGYEEPDYFCTLGEIKFQTSCKVNDAIFEQLPHRAYFRAEKDGELAALELV